MIQVSRNFLKIPLEQLKYRTFNITNVIFQSNFITVSIGYEEGKKRQYPMVSDTKAWARTLKDHFPNEHKAIDEFVRVMKEYGKGFDDCCGIFG